MMGIWVNTILVFLQCHAMMCRFDMYRERPLQIYRGIGPLGLPPGQPMEKFKEVFINSQSIYLSWTCPYIPMRTLLLYGSDEGDMKMLEVEGNNKNHTIDNLQPGTSYRIILQFYYNLVDKKSISRVVTTIPKTIHTKGKLKLEIQMLIRQKSAVPAPLEIMESKVKNLLSEFRTIKKISLLHWKTTSLGAYVLVYVSRVPKYHVKRIYYHFLNSLPDLNSDQIGFAYRIYPQCCRPLYYHSFDNEDTWSGTHNLKVTIISTTVSPFQAGACQSSLSVNQSEIVVGSHDHIPLRMLTISVFVKLNMIRGLNPVVTSVNYKTQMRMEIQEGKVTWMFYNIEQRKGFILTTQPLLKPHIWTHIYVDYDVISGVCRLFINGHLQETGTSRVEMGRYWLMGMKIGKYISGGIEYKLDGLLDELHVFGCLLTLKDVRKMVNSCGMHGCKRKRKGKGAGKMLGKFHMLSKPSNKIDIQPEYDPKKVSCHLPGTEKDYSLTENTTSAICKCKKNVEGLRCDVCKTGTFYLHTDNKDGCIQCYCSNVTYVCQSANMYRKQIILGAQDIQLLTLRTIDGMKSLSNKFLYNPLTNAVTFKSFRSSDQGLMFYWELPLRYCGDKVTSYGGNLRYTIVYLSRPYDDPTYGPDVVLIGGGKELYYSETDDPLPGQQFHYQVILDEKFWRHENGAKVSRGELIAALASIKSFLLRAMFSTEMIETSLYEVRLDIAGYDPLGSNNRVIPMLEQCRCPLHYFGTSCQHCNKGYTKNTEERGDRCKPCKCNGHAEDCDRITGRCKNCRHMTTGKNCEECLPGYYGDPRNGNRCKPCTCPLPTKSNQFSNTCFMDEDGDQTCDKCDAGHIGRLCEKCDAGYYGQPTKLGDYCRKIPSLSGRITPSVHITPNVQESFLNTRTIFNCTVTGPQPTSIVWQRADRSPLPSTAKVISSGMSVILVLRYIKLEDEGEYVCKARNYFGSGHMSSYLIIKGGEVDHIRVEIVPRSLVIGSGGVATFVCRDDSISESVVVWSREDGQVMPPDAIVNKRILTIINVSKRHSGLYVCTGSNRYSIDKATAYLKVKTEGENP